MFWLKPKAITFDDVQRILVIIFRDVRCNDWADRVAAASASSFQSLLGGMGSLSDLVICRENHHEISLEREALANELVSCLTSICYAASRQPTLSADAAVAACSTFGLVLTGWRCLVCGYAQTSSRGVRSLIATIQVRRAIRDSVTHPSPSVALLALWRAREDPDAIRLLIEQAQASGILHTEGDQWMRLCPRCHSDDTCVYRWRLDQDGFVPTEDNLPGRTGQQQGPANRLH
jgi:hypothetical protein